MKETNCAIFDRLKRQVVAHGFWGHVARGDAVRYITTTSEDEKEVLKHGKVEIQEQCLSGRVVAVISTPTRRFVVLPEACDEAIPFLDGMLSRADTNAGLMTIVLSLDDYPLLLGKEDAAEMADKLFAKEGGYDVAEVMRFFAPVHAWELDPAKAREPVVDVYRYYAAFHLGKSILPYPVNVRSALRALLEGSCGTLAPEALFRAITSIHWHHAFLELYRCVEQFFVAPYVCELADALGQPKRTVAEQVVAHIPWKPIEEVALTKLLDIFPAPRRAELLHLLSPAPLGASRDPTAENVAKVVYRTRNAIAHYRGKQEVRRDCDWPAIIDQMCALIDMLTAQYGAIHA